MKTFLITMMIISLMMIGSGCIDIQAYDPKPEIQTRTYFIEMDGPAVRLAEPVKAKILIKDEEGNWVEGGATVLPAGAYVKGRRP